jgi:hypothetical protein
MTVEATLPGREPAVVATIETGRQENRRDALEAVGLLLGILVILLVVTLVIGVTLPGA